MQLQLTNSFGGHKEPFIPQRQDEVRMYVCGPTVYNYAHIGNARPAVVFDVLARVLRRHFSNVIYARNLTDVDDKINAAALAQDVPIGIITERYTAAYRSDMTALGVRPPTIEPKVTEHIPEIIDLIARLIAAENAYDAEAHVLFHVPSFEDYGALSRRSPLKWRRSRSIPPTLYCGSHRRRSSQVGTVRGVAAGRAGISSAQP